MAHAVKKFQRFRREPTRSRRVLLASSLQCRRSADVLRCIFFFVAFFSVCWACFRTPYAWLPRSFAWTPLRWLGNMSYSYYLLHGLALKAGFLALSTVLPIASYGSWLFWVLLPPMFVLTLIPASVLFLLVERPLSLSPRKTKKKLSGLPIENAPNTTLQGALRDKAAQRR